MLIGRANELAELQEHNRALTSRWEREKKELDAVKAIKEKMEAEQVKLGLPADSYPTPELVAKLQGR